MGNCAWRTCRNFRQTADLSLHIAASETDIEKNIREVLDKLLRFLELRNFSLLQFNIIEF